MGNDYLGSSGDNYGLPADKRGSSAAPPPPPKEDPIHALSAAPLGGNGMQTAKMLATAVPQVAGALKEHANQMALRQQGPGMKVAAQAPAANKMNPYMLHMKPLELKPPGAKN